MADQKSKIGKAKKTTHYFIDLGVAIDDDLMIGKEFVDFLKGGLKVNGKKGNLADNITILLEKKKVA